MTYMYHCSHCDATVEVIKPMSKALQGENIVSVAERWEKCTMRLVLRLEME